MAFHPYFVPDFIDCAIRRDQKSAAHDSFKNPAHKFLWTPYSIRLNHLVSRIAEQRKVEFLLRLEISQSFFRIGANAQDNRILFVEAPLCVAKLGRLRRSTWRASLGKEKQRHALSFEIFE
jgi:hypothetical protein